MAYPDVTLMDIYNQIALARGYDPNSGSYPQELSRGPFYKEDLSDGGFSYRYPPGTDINNPTGGVAMQLFDQVSQSPIYAAGMGYPSVSPSGSFGDYTNRSAIYPEDQRSNEIKMGGDLPMDLQIALAKALALRTQR